MYFICVGQSGKGLAEGTQLSKVFNPRKKSKRNSFRPAEPIQKLFSTDTFRIFQPLERESFSISFSGTADMEKLSLASWNCASS